MEGTHREVWTRGIRSIFQSVCLNDGTMEAVRDSYK